MKAKLLMIVSAAIAIALLVQGFAWAAFAPTMSWEFSSTRAKQPSDLTVSLTQDASEEALREVQIDIPAGFTIAGDDSIAHDTALGAGTLDVAAGPGCASEVNQPDATAPQSLPVVLLEQDRTEDQSSDHAEWLLVINPVDTSAVPENGSKYTATDSQKVPLAVSGSKNEGWTILGTVAENDILCGPLSLDLTVSGTLEDGTVVFQNPRLPKRKKAKKYTITTTFTSGAETPTVFVDEDIIKITRK